MSFAVEGSAWGALLAAASLGLAAWSWARLSHAPRAIRILRTAALCWLALCLLRVVPQRIRTTVTKPKLALLIDTSPSMGNRDEREQTRLARIVDWLRRHRQEIESRADPALYVGADRARRISWEELDALRPGSATLDAGQAVDDVSREGAARIWLFSDGGASQGGALSGTPSPDIESEKTGPSSSIPIALDAAGVGPKGPANSARIAEIRSPDFVFLHSPFSLSASVEADGLRGSSIVATLWEGNRALAQRRLEARDDFEVLTASFTAVAQSLGQEDYRLEIQTGDPRSEAMDSREFQVEAIRQKHRIMYLAGRPSPEYASLREYLKSDPNNELVSFVILRNPENLLPVPDQELSLIPFPAQEIFVNDLMQFDMFILENFAYWRFGLPPLYLENLRRFVSQGGALLVIGGADAFTHGGYRGTPLEQVLPVNLWDGPQDFSPGIFRPKVMAADHPLLRVGQDAADSKAIWQALSPLDGFNRFHSLKSGASLLLAHPTEKTMEGGPSPVLAVWSYGKGRVMILGTDSTWRWRLGAGLDWKLSNVYGRFWSGAVQYLSGTLDLKKVRFSPLPKRLVAASEPLTVGLRLFDASFRPLSGSEAELRVAWTPPGGKPRSVVATEREPGIFELHLTGLASGRHRLLASARYRGQPWGEDEISFDWDPRPPRLPLNRRWLKELSSSSGGRYADLDRVDLGGWLEALPSPRPQSEVLRRWQPWDTPWALALLAVLLLAEWWLRRRYGLL